jgi:Na+/proline symporter
MVAGLHTVDWLVILIYFIGITAFGVWASRRIKKLGDFFMPRRFGKWMMAMHGFGTGAHSAQAVSVASKSFTNGLSGIWYQWLWLFVTPFYWLIAPVMRRFRAITTADVFEARYDRSVAMLYAVFGVFGLMVNIGLMLKGSGAVVASCFGNAVSANLVIIVMTALFLIYGMAGGLSAAILTDFIQGLLTVVFSFLLLPFILKAVGGLSGLHESLADTQMFSLFASTEITVFYVMVIAVNGLIGVVAQPHTMGNCAAGKTEMAGRAGFTWGTLLKRVCTVAWCLTGLAAVAYFAGQNIDPDNVYGMIAGDFLPRILPGLLGIFIAALLASVMSSCDSFMIASSALFTENLYRPFFRNRTERHYILVGRITALGIVLGGMALAFKLPTVISGLELFWKVGPMMGIAFWMGFFWRRMTVKGAWASTVGALGMLWLTSQPFFASSIHNLPFAGTLKMTVLDGEIPVMNLPWQMIFYLLTGVLAGFIVSLLSRRVESAKLENYYRLIKTPVEPGEPSVEEPCTLPEGLQTITRKELFPGRSFHLPIPSRTSFLGFFGMGILITLLIFSVGWIIAR